MVQSDEIKEEPPTNAEKCGGLAWWVTSSLCSSLPPQLNLVTLRALVPSHNKQTRTGIRSPCPRGCWAVAPWGWMLVAWTPWCSEVPGLGNYAILSFLVYFECYGQHLCVYAGMQHDLIPFYSEQCQLRKDASLPMMQFRISHLTFPCLLSKLTLH